MLPLLKQTGELEQRSIFWHFPAYLQSYGRKSGRWNGQRDPLFRSRPVSVIRDGDWKLHEYFEDGTLELYNLADDIGESKNLATTHPEKASELHTKLKQWREKTGAAIPTDPNPQFDADVEKAAITKRARGDGFQRSQ